jgi:DNA-binding transcriptional regulator YiaG
MTPADLKAARRALGLSQAELARVVGVASDRTVRKWEDAERDIPGPVIVLMHAVLALPALRRHLGLPSALSRPAATPARRP